jgi:hypothetical protein
METENSTDNNTAICYNGIHVLYCVTWWGGRLHCVLIISTFISMWIYRKYNIAHYIKKDYWPIIIYYLLLLL